MKDKSNVLPSGKYKIIFSKNINNGVIKKNKKSEIIVDGVLENVENPSNFKNLKYKAKFNFVKYDRTKISDDLNTKENNWSQKVTIDKDNSNKSNPDKIDKIFQRQFEKLRKTQNNFWSNLDRNNTNQENDINQITLKTVNKEGEWFDTLKFSWFDFLLTQENQTELFLPSKLNIQYSMDEKNFFNVQNQNKIELQDFGPVSGYKETIGYRSLIGNSFLAYEGTNATIFNIDFNPTKAKYIRIKWTPQVSYYSNANNKKLSAVTFSGLQLRILDKNKKEELKINSETTNESFSSKIKIIDL
ncbi:hypothetical protein KQ876_00910 [Mycoplasma sp. CSL7491-lung]|uniref:hypothetical protein n=1 Tax=Mycoplasma sp. CSL7491-lung TaxID=549718 RepID=UPI001C1159FB|nr:hypothetical protein [Mycoplasma sp. CSL7491-lung]MBU4692764.1 hypothetical protein [Mycoplasma sp. CSL7491-lung]